jgi:hypothetical protein
MTALKEPVNGTSLLERLRSYTGVREQRIKPPPPTIEEIFASPDNLRLRIDPEYEELFDKAVTTIKDSPTRGSQEWNDLLLQLYGQYVDEFYKNGGVNAFRPATDEELQQWATRTRSSYNDEVKALHESLTPAEDLQKLWRAANEEEKKHILYSKIGKIYVMASFQRSIRVELEYTKEWVRKQNAPPPPPKPEIELPPEWFAGEDEGAPANSIRETIQLLAPNVHLALEKVLPEEMPIKVVDDYVYVGDEKWGFKVSRTLGCYWEAHHGHWNPVAGDLLNLFKMIFGIDDDRKAWKKLDALRRRVELEDPEIRAQKARAREKRKLDAEKKFLAVIEDHIGDFIEKAGRTTPPPPVGKKRPKRTIRAFCEWFFGIDGLVTPEQLKAAFEYKEKAGRDFRFRVESKVYKKLTNWFLTKTATPDKVIQKTLSPEKLAEAQRLNAQEEARLNGQITEGGSQSLIRRMESQAKK